MCPAVFGQQQDIRGHRAAAGHGYGAPGVRFITIRSDDDGIVVAEVIEEGHVEQLAAAAEVGEEQLGALVESPPVDGLSAPLHCFVQQLTFAVVNVEDDVGVWRSEEHTSELQSL